MTHDEMRFLRRELISKYLRMYSQADGHSITIIVRQAEHQLYGYELQAYKEF